MKKLFTLKNIVFGIGLIVFDLAIYVFIGLLLMGYDDFYDESKGVYWSWASMTFEQKISYFSLYLWHFVNVFLIVFLICKIVKKQKN